MGERGAKTRIFLVDDHPLVRESLTSLIDQQADMVVCGEAEDSAGGLRAIAAINQVRTGKLGVSDEVSTLFAERFVHNRPRSGTPVEELSDRELEVFRLLGQGLDTRSVANTLHISIKTVQAYCARIKQKLRLSTATELLRQAVRWQQEQARA